MEPTFSRAGKSRRREKWAICNDCDTDPHLHLMGPYPVRAQHTDVPIERDVGQLSHATCKPKDFTPKELRSAPER